ncbi:synaptosomal-associated protein 25-like [Octopus sinensis]|uniref:Synaptosomal-associated protein 25-like n=1 Tax=Octopus sinensis TaxID=2607531 RepID=A0A6P7TR76_9MOLL|nr:synaptosomal-associated protein 25-like [Octopus sinensis]
MSHLETFALSLQSTRRMVENSNKSKDAGIRTLVMLDEQGEQLDKIEENMQRVNRGIEDAEKNLEGLEKCCGLFVLPWKNLTNDQRETQMEENIGEVMGVMTNLRNMAIDIGAEFKSQNKQITRINNMAISNEARVELANKRANKILKN